MARDDRDEDFKGGRKRSGEGVKLGTSISS